MLRRTLQRQTNKIAIYNKEIELPGAFEPSMRGTQWERYNQEEFAIETLAEIVWRAKFQIFGLWFFLWGGWTAAESLLYYKGLKNHKLTRNKQVPVDSEFAWLNNCRPKSRSAALSGQNGDDSLFLPQSVDLAGPSSGGLHHLTPGVVPLPIAECGRNDGVPVSAKDYYPLGYSATSSPRWKPGRETQRRDVAESRLRNSQALSSRKEGETPSCVFPSQEELLNQAVDAMFHGTILRADLWATKWLNRITVVLPRSLMPTSFNVTRDTSRVVLPLEERKYTVGEAPVGHWFVEHRTANEICFRRPLPFGQGARLFVRVDVLGKKQPDAIQYETTKRKITDFIHSGEIGGETNGEEKQYAPMVTVSVGTALWDTYCFSWLTSRFFQRYSTKVAAAQTATHFFCGYPSTGWSAVASPCSISKTSSTVAQARVNEVPAASS